MTDVGPHTTPPEQMTCASLYPGGHGEERECVLPAGHEGAHKYGRARDTALAPRSTLYVPPPT